MRYSQLVGPGRSETVEAPLPEPKAGQVSIDVTACGVCASELHPWLDGPDTAPRRLGHEPVGTVRAVGPDVTRFRPGDRVTGLFKGAYSECCLAEQRELLAVPANVPDVAALGEPLATLINAQRRTRVELADRVAVIGLGFMGLATLQLLRLRGPSRLVAIDPRADARAAALTLGADEAFHPAAMPTDRLLTRFDEWETAKGFEVVVEASGTQPGLTLAGQLVRAHGLLSILGYHQGGPRDIDVGMWNWKAIDVVNAHVRRFADLMESMQIGLDLLASGRLRLDGLVTHRYRLDDVDRAFADLRDKPAGFVKAVVVL